MTTSASRHGVESKPHQPHHRPLLVTPRRPLAGTTPTPPRNVPSTATDSFAIDTHPIRRRFKQSQQTSPQTTHSQSPSTNGSELPVSRAGPGRDRTTADHEPPVSRAPRARVQEPVDDRRSRAPVQDLCVPPPASSTSREQLFRSLPRLRPTGGYADVLQADRAEEPDQARPHAQAWV